MAENQEEKNHRGWGKLTPGIKRLFIAWIPLALAALLLGALGAWAVYDIKLGVAKIILCLWAILLVVFGWIADYKKTRWLQIAATVLIIALAIAAVHKVNHDKMGKGLVRKLHAWNMFHYILASKYFDEIGYFDLYTTALLADSKAKGGNYFSKVHQVRDMHTYRHISRKKALREAKKKGVKERFTKERWKSFQYDLRKIQVHRPRAGWRKTLNDRGFNPSPAWLILHRPFLNSYDFKQRNSLRILATIQLWLFVAVFFVAWWGFGLRKTCLMTTWFTLHFGIGGRMMGG